MTIEKPASNMIEQQIRPWNVLEPGRARTAHHRPPRGFRPRRLRAQAFRDTELPLGNGRRMLAPRVEARMLQELKLSRQDRVLEIGAATGHLAALMAHQAEQVFAIEPDAALADAAKANLRKAGVQNAVLQQVGASGLAAEAPFDAIVLRPVAEVPAGLLAQLRVGTGRLTPSLATTRSCRLVCSPASAPTTTAPHLFETSAARLPALPELPSFAF